MKIYILTSVAVLTERNGHKLDPEIHNKTFLSVVEAQLEMNSQFDAKCNEAEANGHIAANRTLHPTWARLTYDDDYENDINWEIFEQEVLVGPSLTREDFVKEIISFVKSAGIKDRKGNYTLELPAGIAIGGWLLADGEEISGMDIYKNDELVLRPDGFTNNYKPEDLPADDLEQLYYKLKEHSDTIRMYQKYYQPVLVKNEDVPDGLASFFVFPTKEECEKWMENNNYTILEYNIREYNADDIEDPTFIDAEGNVILSVEDMKQNFQR